jgi:hypothetical protein
LDDLDGFAVGIRDHAISRRPSHSSSASSGLSSNWFRRPLRLRRTYPAFCRSLNNRYAIALGDAGGVGDLIHPHRGILGDNEQHLRVMLDECRPFLRVAFSPMTAPHPHRSSLDAGSLF